MTKPTPLLHLTSQDEWRDWLAKHHDSQQEVWLVFYKQHTGRPRIPYEQAVEEALCFGWIDSIVRRIDEDRYAQKFTPRRAGSNWSELNRRRFTRLVREGRMTEAGLAKSPPRVPQRNTQQPARNADSVPAYITAALKKNRQALRNFENLAPHTAGCTSAGSTLPRKKKRG